MDNVLNLTPQEARTLSFQCEFYARMRMGQFAELPFHYLDIRALGADCSVKSGIRRRHCYLKPDG